MVLPASFHELAAKVRNWGRWGSDDEIGTLNLIDTDAVRRGVAAVRKGRPFSLALPLQSDGIQLGFIPGRINPELTFHQLNEALDDPDGVRFSDDQVRMGLQAATHWDALAHVSYDGRLYNGYPADSITAESGAAHAGIACVGPVVSRGLLLDIARVKGVDRLEGGYAVTGEDLDAAAEMGRIDPRPGDIVLIRTGQVSFLRTRPPDKLAYALSTGGPGLEAVPWFREKDIAAVATDNLSFEVYPWEDPAVAMPVHILDLVEIGLTQGQNWMLEDLAADCADDNVYEFLLDATPQPFVGAVGSPVNPVAIK